MSIEVKWDVRDEETGERRYYLARKFAKEWHFKVRHHRRGDWEKVEAPTREMWEEVLEALRRRLPRRGEGVEESDIAFVEKALRGLPAEGEEE